ncbi:MAG: hypothetical protein OIF40_10540 [Mangrovicoccus sp.]|nr:hypothetical protein [Mangrovicoccus sp.]
MSIAPLKKLTLAGPIAQKADILARLQALGCVHLLPISLEAAEPEQAPTRAAEDAYKALRFLAEVEGKRRQISRDPGFETEPFVEKVLDLKQELREALDRRDFLDARIKTLEPWGELVFPDRAVLGGNSLWFYELPAKERAALETLDLPWEVFAQDGRHLYVGLVSREEPPSDLLPVPRVHLGAKSRSRLLEELEEAELALEELQAERVALTRFLRLFRARMSEAETQAELQYALAQTRDDTAVFALRGWVPEDHIPALEQLADDQGLAMITQAPDWHETPPTLLEQPEKEAAGVDLAMFYQVPNYRGWDPTILIIASFAVFFAMIVADAGYGLVILLGLLLSWKKLGGSSHAIAWRRLGLIIAGSTIAYGVIVGSYFGAAPPEGGLLARIAFLDLNNFDVMMRLSILIGAAHIIFAIAMNAWVIRGQRSAKAQLGWIGAILGGLLLWLSGQDGFWGLLGWALLFAGLGAVAVFSSERPIETPLDWLWRALDGLKALTGVMGAFGDILSYMRLFALGLASASLALTFNQLAMQVIEAVPGIGLLFGLLIFLVGHVLNFALGMMSGVVHGLRLNYIEFFKWGLPEEGEAFRPLTRKEVQE